MRKYVVRQVENTILGKAEITPGIPEGAVWDRLTHRHSSHKHGTHTVGLEIFFQALLL